MDTREKD